MSSPRAHLVGNRIALAGTVVYFTEWLVIPFVPGLPFDVRGQSQDAVMHALGERPGATGLAAGLFAIIMLGRLAFAAGLRGALRHDSRVIPFADLALVAMTVGVVLELVEYGLISGAAWLARDGMAPQAVIGLDVGGAALNSLILVTTGASALAASWAMRQSGMFRPWLGWLGLVGGALAMFGGVGITATLGADGLATTISGITTSLGLLAFWVWMITTAIVLFRSAPPKGAAPSHVPVAATAQL